MSRVLSYTRLLTRREARLFIRSSDLLECTANMGSQDAEPEYEFRGIAEYGQCGQRYRIMLFRVFDGATSSKTASAKLKRFSHFLERTFFVFCAYYFSFCAIGSVATEVE